MTEWFQLIRFCINCNHVQCDAFLIFEFVFLSEFICLFLTDRVIEKLSSELKLVILKYAIALNFLSKSLVVSNQVLSLKLFNNWSIIDFDKSIRNYCQSQLWRVWLKIIIKLMKFKFRLFEINLLEFL